MLITVLLLILVVSFFIHIVFLTIYVLTKGKKFLAWFLVTFGINVIMMSAIMIIALKGPADFRHINMGFFLWLLSGVVFFVLSTVKIVILKKIFKRSRDPEYFHYNFFGRKVYNRGIIRKQEFFIIIGQMPFFLFMGAYFIGKLVNIILHGLHF